MVSRGTSKEAASWAATTNPIKLITDTSIGPGAGIILEGTVTWGGATAVCYLDVIDGDIAGVAGTLDAFKYDLKWKKYSYLILQLRILVSCHFFCFFLLCSVFVFIVCVCIFALLYIQDPTVISSPYVFMWYDIENCTIRSRAQWPERWGFHVSWYT